MKVKMFFLNGALFLFGSFQFCALGQRIGVIERNNFHQFDKPPPYVYRFSIRELFEKENGTWSFIDNFYNEHEISGFKTNTQYLLQEGTRKITVKGTRGKKDVEPWLASPLFRVSNPSGIVLNKLSAKILQGFEQNDITSLKIVTGSSVPRENISLFKTEYLTDSLKDKLYALLAARQDSCQITDFRKLEREHIHNTVRVLPDGLKLGQVDVAPQNTCFTDPGRSYGGGVLHYIIYPNQEIRLLVTNTELIDAADYDNDGKLEYIFFKSWFNNYGYIMYYNNFQQEVVNEWWYH